MLFILCCALAIFGPLAAAFTNPLADLLGREQTASGEFLPPDEAFSPPHIEIETHNSFAIRWRVADGYYLYQDRFRFKLAQSRGIKLGHPEIPRGMDKDLGDGFGPMAVLQGNVAVTLPIIFRDDDVARRTPEDGEQGKSSDSSPTGATPERITTLEITVGYQGCAEAGFCYPPITKNLRVEFPLARHHQ
ncbi:MAG: protein-disulfide reductase DsbD N-terminal domain-containing protein [Gammaproteobacteria bacterium]|nr:protein-disulfide reductase DsbD N-terminal domain-containing protein [Gammaproteobacteria bacterium]NNJ83387.1 hypothetical protein [Gammaproteobacteria bacterium]